jgi:hypothetical protein
VLQEWSVFSVCQEQTLQFWKSLSRERVIVPSLIGSTEKAPYVGRLVLVIASDAIGQSHEAEQYSSHDWVTTMS